jgi:hypothetical protein
MEGKSCSTGPVSCSTEEKKEGGCGPKDCGPKDCGPKKGCCGIIIKGAITGAIVMFLYMAVSWMLVPWHMSALHSFKDEKGVAATFLKSAPQSGIYILPYTTSPDQKPAIDKPFAFVSVMADGFDCAKGMPGMLLGEFALCLGLSALLTCLLKKQSGGCPVLFSFKIGLLVGLVHNIPNVIWWHFPADFTLITMIDDVLSFTLAGLVIAKCVLKLKIGCGAKTACGTGGACPGCGCSPCKCAAAGGCGTKTACGTADKDKACPGCGCNPCKCGGGGCGASKGSCGG